MSDNKDLQVFNGGIRYLLNIGAFDNNVVQEVLVENIKNCSLFIKNIELKIDPSKKYFYIFIELSFVGNKLKNKSKLAKKICKKLSEAIKDYSIIIYYNIEKWKEL